MMKKTVYPSWPQINSEIFLQPYQTFKMKLVPLNVNFIVNTQSEEVIYTLTSFSEM